MRVRQRLLAYAEGRAVGWCYVAPRSRIPNLRRYAAAVEDPSDDPAVIMCFVITPEHRGRGVAKALVRASIDAAQEWGSPWLEAYPWQPELDVDDEDDDTPWTAAQYKGPLSMYEHAGFVVARRIDDWLVVRHDLESSEGPLRGRSSKF